MSATTTHHGGTSHHLLRILTVLLMFVAMPLQMWGGHEVYQKIILEKPTSKGDTLLIYNREQLLWWAVNTDNKSIKLMADINVQGDKQLLKADGKTLALKSSEIVVWPYVKYDSDRYWYGEMKPRKVINGNNHTISGIYQNYGYGDWSSRGAIKAYDIVGFISWASHDISIWDLNITDSYLVGKYAGGFMGQKSKNATSTAVSEFRNCSFRGYVKGSKYAGGFTGWYRTNGQDAKFYRCFNYGTIEGGSATSTDIEASTGGLIGYLDIMRTNFAQAHTNFNRCVNYGNITCFTPGGSVGGNIGKVYDNNNGKREWRFCFNLGDIRKYDRKNNPIIGSGLLGNYTNTEGEAQPKILGCGNTKKAETGTLLDSLSWNYKDHTPFVVTGSKTNSSSQIYSSIKKDDSWASWWSNHWGSVTMFAVVAIVTFLTMGAGLAMGAFMSGLESFASLGAAAISGIISAAAALVGVTSLASFILSVILLALASFSAAFVTGYAELYHYIRNSANASNIMASAPITYADSDIRKAYFAYDANLMMQADSIGDEANTDKSILFKQHIDLNESTNNDTIPMVITDFSSNADKLYFGYDKCYRFPELSNDPNMLKTPVAHTYDSHGECTYCHMKQQPLGVVYKEDQQTVDYYTIENEAQLNYLANAFNGDNEEAYKLYDGASFKLIADINYPDRLAWTPIGSTSEDFEGSNASASANWHPFRGVFDGQGHTIKGLRTNDYTNYAGLFGCIAKKNNIEVSVSNVLLSNCFFSGNVAGTIAGRIDVDTSNDPLSAIYIDKVCADSSVIVAATGKDKYSYAGGFIGKITGLSGSLNDLIISYCYSNANLLVKGVNANAKLEDMVGCYIGALDEWARSNKDKGFKHCYFGGVSPFSQNAIGSIEGVAAENTIVFEDSYNIGTASTDKKATGQFSPQYVEYNYMTSGRLANDLMENSKVTENGVTTYFFTQKGNYPVLTNSKQPTLCKVIVGERNTGVQIADTIININTTKLAAPIEYAGQKFDKAVLYGWNNEKCEGDPAYKGQLNDFSELYKTPTRYYALVLNPENIPAIANIQSETEWKGAGVLAGYQQTNIMENLYLQGSNAWSLQLAPQCIDGNNKTVRAGMPLISNIEDATSAARRYSRARGVGARASQESADITIQNLRVQTDILTQDVLSKGARKLNLSNLILEPVDADETIFDWNSVTKTANTNGLNLKNVVCRKNDSTSVAFYKDGTDVMATTFSDKNKNNDYEHILNYMLSQEGMLDVFGLRLSGKNEKVAGKFGFASEESKRIYRVKTYNQSTGLAEGEILMNYDGDVTFDVKGTRVGTMHEGLPDGTFAVLPFTKEELGDKFQNLGKNIITKDGKAKCIRLEEDKIDGFTFPSCFNTEETSLMADCGEFVRKVRRDGSFESLILPFGFMSLDIAEKDFSESDELELCFLNFAKEENPDGVSEDGTSLKLTTSGSYAISKEQLQIDSLQDDEVALPATPYLIRFKCSERTDEMSTITFSLSDPRGAVIFFSSANTWSVFDPMFGVFQNSVVSELEMGKDKKVYTLESLMDEITGKPYANFTKAKPTDHIKAFHCYLATSSSLAGDNIKVTLDDGTTTGINGILNSNAKAKNKIYDMLGRRVTKMKPRNIYIQNGKKVVNF